MSTSDPVRYLVQISHYAKRHYIKKFEKKYPGKQWDTTLKSLLVEMARIEENLLHRKGANQIHTDGARAIIKYEFRVANTKESSKSSGNRIIALVDRQKVIVTILLVYSKNEISAPGETAKWEKEIKDNFPSLTGLIN